MSNGILGWLETANKYSDLIKTGVAAASTYASYQDQKKKNRMQQQAYEDYMAQVNEAGKEARAAIDINYTPMTVSGVPTTKADVTDFTAVAAKGGLMSIPNKQRKRYYGGTDEEEVMEIDEEVLSPFDLQQETGIDLTGEQVKYDIGNTREGAWNVWNSGAIDQEIYEFDFEIFFESGDWMDMLKGDVPIQGLQGNTMMASADPMLQDEYDKYVFDLQEINPEATPMSIEDFRQQAVAGQANGGIIGLRHGGRPGFYRGSDRGDFSLSELLNPRDPQNELIAEHMQIGKLPHNITARILELNRGGKSYEDIAEITGVNIEDITSILEVANNPQIIDPVDKQGKVDYDIWDDIMAENISIRERPEHLSYNAQGGRIGYAFGPGPVVDQETMAESITLPDGGEEVVTDSMTEIEGHTAGGGARGWKAQMLAEELAEEQYGKEFYDLTHKQQMEIYTIALDMIDSGGNAKGGLPKRVRKAPGGIMNLGGLEKDYRTTGGFVPIGAYEKKDDVPARLSKNEFVMTADAVRAAGGGSINKGAQLMYDTMKHLEAQPTAKRMTA